MAKTRKCDRVYIEVDIDMFLCNTEKKKRELAETIAKDINRHIDSLESVVVCDDAHDVCEFCEYDWEIGFADGKPQCCDKAIEEWGAEKDKADEPTPRQV